METKRGGYAHDQKHARTIFRALSILHESEQQRHIQTQGNQHALEALLFRPCRHDEVGVANGNVAELILRAVTKTFSPKTAGTYGDFRLEQLVAGTFCIVFRMEEGGDSLPLIRLENVLTHRRVENTPD